MSPSNPFFKSVRESSGIRLAVLFGAFFIFLLFTSLFTAIIDKAPGEARTHMLIGSIVQSGIAFCLPAFILARFCSHEPAKWLYLTKSPPLKAIYGVIIVYGISMPAMEWLIEWNSNIHFPEALSSLETLFRQWEQAGEESTKILLDTHGWVATVSGVLVVGVLTGFSEELFFRGGLQGILTRSSIGRHLAIWLAAFIFSAMHFQFFGFIPRLLMGVFFGYLLFWSKSIWVPIFAHALNNSMVVIASAFTGDPSQNLFVDENTNSIIGNSLTVVGSIVLTTLFIWLCKDSLFKSNKSETSLWQKSQLPPVSEK